MNDIEEKCKLALQALNDWAVTYAPDMCSDESVARAKARIHEHGTLAYIANATDQLHAAILALSEAEKREKEARAKALEEAAKVAETRDDLNGNTPLHVLALMNAAGPVTIARQAVSVARSHIAASIRALQSEER